MDSKLATAIKYINNVITILLSVIAWILAYADQVKPLVDLVSPEVASKWPVVIPAIMGVRAILSMIGDLVDDGKINQSFKALLLCFGGIFVFSMLTACALTETEKAQIKATGSYITSKVSNILLNTVLQAAVSASDAEKKADFAQGFAEALRSNQGQLLTSRDVTALTEIWTPDKPHWRRFGAEVAAIYEQRQPKNAREAALLLEEIAKGIDSATAKAP